jgi:hypothetical protein
MRLLEKGERALDEAAESLHKTKSVAVTDETRMALSKVEKQSVRAQRTAAQEFVKEAGRLRKLGRGAVKLLPWVGIAAGIGFGIHSWSQGRRREAVLDWLGTPPGPGDVIDMLRLGHAVLEPAIETWAEAGAGISIGLERLGEGQPVPWVP